MQAGTYSRTNWALHDLQGTPSSEQNWRLWNEESSGLVRAHSRQISSRRKIKKIMLLHSTLGSSAPSGFTLWINGIVQLPAEKSKYKCGTPPPLHFVAIKAAVTCWSWNVCKVFLINLEIVALWMSQPGRYASMYEQNPTERITMSQSTSA